MNATRATTRRILKEAILVKAIFEDLKSEKWKKQKWQNHIYGKVLKNRFNLHEMLHDFSSTVGPID